MRGILLGSLGLIVLYVVLQDGVTGKLETGSGVVVAGLRRFLSPQVAGVPQRAGKAAHKAEKKPPVTTWVPGMTV